MAFVCYRGVRCSECQFEHYDDEIKETVCTLRRDKDTEWLREQLSDILASTTDFAEVIEKANDIPGTKSEMICGMLIVMAAINDSIDESVILGYSISPDLTLRRMY